MSFQRLDASAQARSTSYGRLCRRTPLSAYSALAFSLRRTDLGLSFFSFFFSFSDAAIWSAKPNRTALCSTQQLDTPIVWCARYIFCCPVCFVPPFPSVGWGVGIRRGTLDCCTALHCESQPDTSLREHYNSTLPSESPRATNTARRWRSFRK